MYRCIHHLLSFMELTTARLQYPELIVKLGKLVFFKGKLNYCSKIQSAHLEVTMINILMMQY